MAEAIIQLEVDEKTQKKSVVIKYISDSDALPHEHEEDTREFVEKVIEKAGVTTEEIDNVVIRRDNGKDIKLDVPKNDQEKELEKQEA